MAQGGCQGNAAPGSARAARRARPTRVPCSGVGCPSLTAPSANVLIKPNPTPVHFLLLQNLYLWQIIKKIKRSFMSHIFWLLKFSFSLASKNRWKRWCVHPSHNPSSLTHCSLCPAPLTCLQDTGDVRKGRVCAPGAELFLLQLSQLRESSPGKGHKLGLHVQPVSKPQFILINIISAAVKLDKII